jgi:Raffinose synthase or seed imbibition protein Sip1
LNHNKDTWKALDLKRTKAAPTLLSDPPLKGVHQYVFEGILPCPFVDPEKTYKGRKIPFTIRYRDDEKSPWQWVRDQFGIKDGELIWQAPVDSNFLGGSPVDLEPGWQTRKLVSEVPEARLYSIDSSQPIPNSADKNTKTETKVLGKVTLLLRFFAIVRIWTPWLAPRHGEGNFNITEDAMLLSFLRSDGLHVVLLAVNGVDDILTLFKSNEAGEIVVAARNDTGKDGKFRLIAATAWDFEIANAAAMCELRKVVRQSVMYQEAASQLPTHIRSESTESGYQLITNPESREPAPTPEWLATWYDNLSYCTWNSLGQDLTLDKIMKGLQSLKDNDIHIATLIIDDNWQDLDGKQESSSQFRRGWKSFEANPEGFPDGLKASTAQIRKAHPTITDIAVWHALLGYWGGIAPDGELAKEYKTMEVTKGDGKMLAIHPDDIHRFYNDAYTFLSSAGVTAVKTDAQFMLDELSKTEQRRMMISPYQSAWTQAHLRHLGGKAISCMSQIPQILFHSFLPTNTPRVMLRNSDDFFPDIPSSHPWHVFCNAHNSLLVQHLNVLPDWDMFQTSHPYSGFHAASRCLSGGPIYITDTPGEHDVGLIQQMCAKNPRGQTVILRPSNVGKSIGIYDNYNEGFVLRIGVYDGKAEVGTGMLGVFNISDHEISYLLPITDIPGVKKGLNEGEKKWVVRSHTTRRITKPIRPTLPIIADMIVQQTLEVRGYDIWSALPVHNFIVHDKQEEIAILGLLGKMTGACAIIESRMKVEGERLKVEVQLKALGVLGIWISGIETRKVDQCMVMIRNMAVPPERVKIDAENSVLEVDVQGAWEDLKLDAGWSNEVTVDIFVP